MRASYAGISTRLLLPSLVLVRYLRSRLATLGAAILLDHLVIDPLMTLIFGNRQFYRSRGYYYDSELG
jgi:hypothetical protein